MCFAKKYFVLVKRNAHFIAESDYWQWLRAPTSIRQSLALRPWSDWYRAK
jgi:DNA-binding transcriptional regulator GbsR (MarR family)